ncbi:MAG: hypothetical protein QOH36_196 [Actinomycetota bacterium]|nr:hypothetical protein [Actinomycetota bacterium]
MGRVWNNANAEVYSLQAWPEVAPGVNASAEITKTSYVVHGYPSERELHYWVKNTGTTQVDIAVWVFWWPYASEWGERVRIRGGRGLDGQLTPPAWSSTRRR